jgi:hypothetical protein
MKPTQPVRTLLAVVAFVLPGTSSAVETFVTFDVVTPDPNDPNYTAPLIEPEPNQQISYSITAIVQAVDPNDEPNLGAGLGAAYVTLNTNFADANCVGAATQVCSTLSLYSCTGLVLGDDVTDIGGSQYLLGDGSSPNAFANGYKVVIASGTLTAPVADGVYHVWVMPGSAANATGTLSAGGGNGASPVSVLGPNLTQAPFGAPPDHITTGPRLLRRARDLLHADPRPQSRRLWPRDGRAQPAGLSAGHRGDADGHPGRGQGVRPLGAL